MSEYGENDPVFLGIDGRRMRGVRQSVQVTGPSVQAEWAITVPGGRYWRPVGGAATFTADANVANRLLGVRILLAGVAGWVYFNTTPVLAGTVATANYVPGDYGAQNAVANNIVPVTLASIWLMPGDTIASASSALQAGDRYTNIVLVVEECDFDPTRELSHAHDERVLRAALDHAIESR